MTTIQQQINQNVQNDHRTGEMTAKTEEELRKQLVDRQKEYSKRKLKELTSEQREEQRKRNND